MKKTDMCKYYRRISNDSKKIKTTIFLKLILLMIDLAKSLKIFLLFWKKVIKFSCGFGNMYLYHEIFLN